MIMNLNFWLDRPPFAITGLLKELNNAGAKITLFVKNDFDSSRNDIDNSTNAEFNYIFYNSFEELEINKQLIKSGINVVNGFNSSALPFLKQLKKEGNVVVGCMTERLNPLGSFKLIKSFLLKLKYKPVVKSSLKDIDFLLPIGEEAKFYFANIGWSKESHSIFYIPDLRYNPNKERKTSKGNIYCYIGRNDYIDKGLDLAIDYFSKHKEKELLIISNYGRNANDVADAILRHSNIKRTDSISPDRIVDIISDEQVKCIIVPSKSDGWNPNVYISLLSLIPCLCSNKTGNSELVSNYKAGFVFKPTKKGFANTIEKFEALDEGELSAMRNNAKAFAISNSPSEHCKKLMVFLENFIK